MKKLLSVLILFVSTLIFAQEEKEKNWVVKFNTVQLLDLFSFPTVMVSAERKINPYFSINAEAGYQLTDCRKREDGRWVREVYIMVDIDSSIHL